MARFNRSSPFAGKGQSDLSRRAEALAGLGEIVTAKNADRPTRISGSEKMENQMSQKKAITIEDLRTKWLNRKVMGSTNHGLSEALAIKDLRPIQSINFDAENESFVAWSGEHHRTNSLEAMDRRLESLVYRA